MHNMEIYLPYEHNLSLRDARLLLYILYIPSIHSQVKGHKKGSGRGNVTMVAGRWCRSLELQQYSLLYPAWGRYWVENKRITGVYVMCAYLSL